MDEARERKARRRKRRIIYNNDGDDAVYARTGAELEHDAAEGLTVRTGGEIIDDFLNARNTPLDRISGGQQLVLQLHGRTHLFAPDETGRLLWQGDAAATGWRNTAATPCRFTPTSATSTAWSRSGRCA